LGSFLQLFYRAYSLGGGTYTGIEAVSNGLQIMREPRVETGRRTMAYMAVSLALTARPQPGGGAVLALLDLTATRRLESVRRDFVANVSHELRTPLTVVGGFAETLVDDDPPPEQRRHFAQMIQASTLRMQRIVDDL
jgi:signal transduction histidine kinase